MFKHFIKDPDLYKQKQSDLQKARIKFQEEYEKNAKIALEKLKEVKLFVNNQFKKYFKLKFK